MGQRILFGGGGTGGHLFPAIAIAETFLQRHPDNRVAFVTAGRPMDLKILGMAGYSHTVIPIEGIKGKQPLAVLRTLFRIPAAVFAAIRACIQEKPDMVIGMGGYSAGPVILAARILGLPTAICEQNAIPGLTNRILGRWVKKIFVSFPDVSHAFPAEKILLTGNPVRLSLRAGQSDPSEKGQDDPGTLLVVGGSQGAQAINRAMEEAIPELKRMAVTIIHQTGEADAAKMENAYAEAGVPHSVQPFFHDMPEQYRKASIVIARAGASTVAELTVLGKCSILIPYPHAADDHQTWNARYVSDAGGAILLPQSELSGKRLGDLISQMIADIPARKEMSARAEKMGMPDAAERILDTCGELIGKDE